MILSYHLYLVPFRVSNNVRKPSFICSINYCNIGINEFTRFNVITAGIAWLITVGGCLLPSLVGDISRAKEDP